mmetsp:Transcript_72684/g.187500  ORF Transcript_72684/g.187500 Transcript_72684/m.187500 type:complete len:313 (-) Transcript_72684:974-1912(-)
MRSGLAGLYIVRPTWHTPLFCHRAKSTAPKNQNGTRGLSGRASSKNKADGRRCEAESLLTANLLSAARRGRGHVPLLTGGCHAWLAHRLQKVGTSPLLSACVCGCPSHHRLLLPVVALSAIQLSKRSVAAAAGPGVCAEGFRWPWTRRGGACHTVSPMLHPVPGCSSYRKSNEVRAGRAARPARTMQEASVRQLEARTVPRLGVPVPTRMRACKRSPRAQRAGPAQTVQRNPRCSAVPRRALRRRAPSAQWRACRRQRCPPVLQEATAPARYLGRPHIAPYARRGAPRGMQGRCRELSARPQREGPPAPPRP